MTPERKKQIDIWWQKWQSEKYVLSIDELIRGVWGLKSFAQTHGISHEEMKEVFKEIDDLEDQLK